MKLAVLVLVLVAACRAGGGDDYPTGPGGGGVVIGGGGSGHGGDAGTGDGGDGDGGIPLSGRVCLLNDLRKIGDATACATKGASGLVVTLGIGTGPGARSATTADDGSFSITAPLGAGFTWHVTGRQIITSAMPFGTDNTIPAVGDTQYTELLGSNSVLLQDQQGSIFVRVVSGTTPVSGVAATSNPAANNLAFYDSNDPLRWDTIHTESFGIAWFPGVPVLPAPATVVLSPPGASAVTISATVENQAITFVTRDLR
jgi:hypothetical protein